MSAQRQLEEVGYKFSRPIVGAAGSAVSAGSKAVLHAWGLVPTVAVLGYLGWRDHEQTKRQLTHEYENEIAARTLKRPEQVDVEDMQHVATENPTLGEALQRSKLKRNLSIGATASCAIGAFAAASAVAGMIASAPLLAAVTSMVVGVSVFMAGQHTIEAAGKKIFKLNEPPLKAVEAEPERQHELCLSSQVKLLENMQRRRQVISQEQVFQAFVAANESLVLEVKEKYGADFCKLAPEKRVQVLQEIGPRYRIESLTEDLNHRLIRAQEVAFAACGQQSGVPKLEVPQITALERAHEELQMKYQHAQARLEEVGSKLKERTDATKEKIVQQVQAAKEHGQEKLAHIKQKVAGVKTPTETSAADAAPPAVAPQQEPSPTHVEKYLASKQKAATATPSL